MDHRMKAERGKYEFTGSDASLRVKYPWTDKPWQQAADAANQGLNGQGYIVHAVMQASRAGKILVPVGILLALVQTAAAVVYLLIEFTSSHDDRRDVRHG